mmetsp:Transcript_78243/g.171539  ORF Transcript_78243/g.171539 Transcript_78243/m.171539 type:complete len:710 (+) Transcript_78243:921-3050(+)
MNFVTQLTHEGEAEEVQGVPGNLALLEGGEREGLVGKIHVGDAGQNFPAGRTLQANQVVVVTDIPDRSLESLLLDLILDPAEVVGGSGPTSHEVEGVLGELGDCQIGHDPTLSIAESSVGNRARLPAFVHACGADPVGGFGSLGTFQEELAEVGLIKDTSSITNSFNLFPHQIDVLAPAEGQLTLQEIVVLVLLVLGNDLTVKPRNRSFVSAEEVILLDPRVGTWHKPARALEAMSRLVNTALLQQELVQRRLSGSSAREGLIMRKDDGVGLRIGLVGSVLHPTVVPGGVGVETGNVHGEHVNRWAPIHNPVGHLPTNATTQHHTHGVEATAVEETVQLDIRADQGLVVWGEGLRATDSALDSQRLDQGAALDVTFEVLVEGVPIQIEETKVEVGVDVLPKFGVLLVATQGQGVALCLEVDGQVMVPQVGETRMHPLDGFSHDVGMFHRSQWDLEVDHVRDSVRPSSSAIDDQRGLDALAASLHCCDLPASLPLDIVSLGLDVLHPAILHKPAAELLCRSLVGIDHASRVDGAVRGRVHGPIDIVDVDDGVEILGLSWREHLGIYSEVLSHRGKTLVFVQSLLVACDEQTAILHPRVHSSLLLELYAHLSGVGVELDIRVGGSKSPQHASSVPCGAGRELVGLKENCSQSPGLEMIGAGRAQRASANDDGIDLFREVRCTGEGTAFPSLQKSPSTNNSSFHGRRSACHG